MGEWNRKLYIGAVQGARPSHNPSLAFGSNRKKEFVAAGPVSRIRRAALQTDKLFEISCREVSMMSTLSVLAGFASHPRHNGLIPSAASTRF
jgi:hypothetical protein